MNKTLSEEFMHRSKLKNQYHKEPTEINKIQKATEFLCKFIKERERHIIIN